MSKFGNCLAYQGANTGSYVNAVRNVVNTAPQLTFAFQQQVDTFLNDPSINVAGVGIPSRPTFVDTKLVQSPGTALQDAMTLEMPWFTGTAYPAGGNVTFTFPTGSFFGPAFPPGFLCYGTTSGTVLGAFQCRMTIGAAGAVTVEMFNVQTPALTNVDHVAKFFCSIGL